MFLSADVPRNRLGASLLILVRLPQQGLFCAKQLDWSGQTQTKELSEMSEMSEVLEKISDMSEKISDKISEMTFLAH